jgi:hypothetical protein
VCIHWDTAILQDCRDRVKMTAKKVIAKSKFLKKLIAIGILEAEEPCASYYSINGAWLFKDNSKVWVDDLPVEECTQDITSVKQCEYAAKLIIRNMRDV